MPTVNPSSLGGCKPQFELADGTPAVGNQLFFYVAGSVNTKQATYTDSTGAVPNANPIVLNSLGMPTTEIWFAAGAAYKVVYAPANDTDPPTSPIFSVDDLLGINDVSVLGGQEWIVFSGAPTFVNATAFTLVGDQTSTFHVGRRVKTTNAGGTIYSTITASVFGALTTVTVLNDSGVLDAGLNAVSYGLDSAVNPSDALKTDAYAIVSGSADKTKKVRFEVDGIATGTTRVLTIPDGDFTLGDGFTTGDVKLTIKTAADTGWVLMDDKTIGNAASGATGRANADTVALFTLLWTNTANAQCAVSTGRGASAAADYAANKTIALPKALGRALATYGAGSGLTSRVLALTTGVETHPLTSAENGPHTHPGAGSNVFGDAGGGTQFTAATTAGASAEIQYDTTGSSGSGTAHQNMQPTLFLNTMIKL